ncbi:hypothetical protein PIB30_073094 [Stylosanthes scabra]|uniref:Uncharacterized protein n=1 Tax=Stylosanthes scabra TaxID=79078 RepID=A0ABU6YRX8_9FABA|nr:hypothetical protein [Stylosanthes scabra]
MMEPILGSKWFRKRPVSRFENCLRVDSSSSESILKRATGVVRAMGVSRANVPAAYGSDPGYMLDRSGWLMELNGRAHLSRRHFIRTENPWVGDSHSVYFRLFRYRFELGKLAKHSSGVFGLASPQIESSVVSCWRISEVCPEYVIGFRALCNGPGLRKFEVVTRVEAVELVNLARDVISRF